MTAWHEGERAAQARTGVAARLAEVGPRVLRDHMPDQHREFFAELPFLLAGMVDAEGQPHAGMFAAAPGFAWSPDPRLLRVDARPLPHDPLVPLVAPGAPIGLLGIQPHTRRRNRMNGWIAWADAGGMGVEVGQSFGNCPKYIVPREARRRSPVVPATVEMAAGLDAGARRLITAADTFFIASAHPMARQAKDPAQGVDVSHRGGPAGFVQLEHGETLVVPDFVGNSFFNTLGNLALEPRCGLLFLDFATGERLHLTARAELQWAGPELAQRPGALRLLRLQVTSLRRVRGGSPLHWTPPAPQDPVSL